MNNIQSPCVAQGKLNLALFNKIRRDTLIRLSDNVETLTTYLARYYGVTVDDKDASALLKAIQSVQTKLVDKRRAERETVNA